MGKGDNGPGNPGGAGVTGIGGPNQGTGVIGKGGADDPVFGSGGIGVSGKGGRAEAPGIEPGVDPGVGVFGQGGLQDDAANITNQPHAPGMIGVAGNAPLPPFQATGGAGVFGQGANAVRKTVTPPGGTPNVSGPASPGPGVLGKGALQTQDGAASGNPSPGVIGLAGDAAFPPFDEASNAGVYGKGNTGVIGVAGKDIGMNIANPGFGIGVLGASNADTGKLAAGVTAISSNSPNFPALIAINNKGTQEANAIAAFFDGDILKTGVNGAAIPQSDGSHRVLIGIESPESWFEDFGEGHLVNGKAEVRLDPEFAAVIVTDQYHVFVTPYGECNGLFVADRNAYGFRVSEQQAGTSNVSFGYRVVAKRKDVVVDRLARVTLPKIPSTEVISPH